MASDTVDELVLRLICRNGVLQTYREGLMEISNTLKDMSLDCSELTTSATVINDVDVPFSKETITTLITLTKKSVTKLEIDEEEKKNIVSAMEWLGTPSNVEETVKEKLMLIQKVKIPTIDPKIFTLGKERNISEIFHSITKRESEKSGEFKVLVHRTWECDFDSIDVNFIIYTDIYDVAEYCVNKYIDFLTENPLVKYEVVSPIKKGGELIMVYEDDDRCGYVDLYGVTDDEYKTIYNLIANELKSRNIEINNGRF